MLDPALHLASQIVDAADRRSGCGFRCVTLSPPSSLREAEAAVAEADRSIRDLGFVSVRPARESLSDIRRDILHRHVALVVADADDRSGAPSWIRALALASPRAHLVVDFREDRPREADLVTPASDAGADAAWRPAESCTCRNNDDAGVDGILHMLRQLDGAGQWRRAADTALKAARSARCWICYARIACAASRALLTSARLEESEGVVAGLIAEALISRAQIPHEILQLYGEVCFWSGRFEEADKHFAGASSIDDAAIPWIALTAWARADLDGVDRALRRMGADDVFGSVRALHASMIGDVTGTTAWVDRWCRRAAGSSVSSPLVDRAICAEALIGIGHAGRALDLLEAPRAIGREPRIEDRLAARLRAACMRTNEKQMPRRQIGVDALDPPGIGRWGLGRQTMSVLHAVPALLQLVHESDDELTTLKRGCAWMRRHSNADAVAVVGGDVPRIVAAEGLPIAEAIDAELSAAVTAGVARVIATPSTVLVASPIRYGGAAIGSVVARGRREIAETLAEAAAALAALLAGAMRARLDAIASAGSHAAVAPEILGRSPAMTAVREAIARSAPTPFAVLIEGASGTGKELVAQALHRLSPRRDRRLAAVNCAALTDDLVEAELFGHSRGAFTGAVAPRTGLFEDANGGTLFLDEVGELSSRAQAKLLRVLQEREIRRVGENLARPVDVRIISATNVDLTDAATHGRFRSDLQFRLAVVRIRLPALRDRIEDVPLLALAFWKPLMQQTAKHAQLGPDALAELCRHSWPGNVRELQNVVAGVAVAAPPRGQVRARHVLAVLATMGPSSSVPAGSLDAALRGFERRMISATLARHGGRRTTAARELGLTRQGLTKALRRLGIATADAEDVA